MRAMQEVREMFRSGNRGLWARVGCGAAVGMLVLMLAACGGEVTPTAVGKKLPVVVTTTQIKSMAEAVAGDKASVQSILKPGADAHEFEPRPSDVAAIAKSALVLKN